MIWIKPFYTVCENQRVGCIALYDTKVIITLSVLSSVVIDCGTLKSENAAICEKVTKCEQISTLNVKIYAICKK